MRTCRFINKTQFSNKGISQIQQHRRSVCLKKRERERMFPFLSQKYNIHIFLTWEIKLNLIKQISTHQMSLPLVWKRMETKRNATYFMVWFSFFQMTLPLKRHRFGMSFRKCFLLVFKYNCDVINLICISKLLELSLPPKLSTRSPFMDQNKEQCIELSEKLLFFSSNLYELFRLCMDGALKYSNSLKYFNI